VFINLRPALRMRMRRIRGHRLLDQILTHGSGPNHGRQKCATKALIDDVTRRATQGLATMP
jgi:hypothetical protein